MIPKNILKNIPLFKNLSDSDLELIAARLQPKYYPRETTIFKEGDKGETLYLVESGQLAVVGKEVGEIIALMGPGSFVGEIALLLASRRTATLQVTIDAKLWALNKKDFEQLISTRASIAKAMLQEIGQRLVETTRRKRRRITRRITALLSNNALALTQALHQQLTAPVALLPLPGASLNGRADISSGVMLLNNENLTETSLVEGLSYQVEVFKHVIILLPPRPTPLAKKAIGLADTVVSIGAPPNWLKTESASRALWQSSGSARDLARIARRLTNRTIGLALSSGGSRGLAHVGVLKVFMEENIPVDLIGGTSGGALFGALYAAGWDYSQMMDYIQELSGLTKLINWDFNLKISTGIVKGRRAYEKYLVKPLKGIGFDNLKIPLYVIAADILTGDEVIFDSGSLPDAIRASASVPVLSSPWFYQGRYLSDGGIVNPLPANVLREHGADIVLASSVIQPLKKSYSGAKDKMPSMLQSIFNIFSAMEAAVVEKQFPFIDILIQHNISAQSTLDFERVDEMIRSGEEAARQALPRIKKIIQKLPTA